MRWCRSLALPQLTNRRFHGIVVVAVLVAVLLLEMGISFLLAPKAIPDKSVQPTKDLQYYNTTCCCHLGDLLEGGGWVGMNVKLTMSVPDHGSVYHQKKHRNGLDPKSHMMELLL
jgi:predicted small integral membrane protein